MLPPKRTVVAIRELVPFQLNEPMYRTSILMPTAYDEAYPVPGLGGDEVVGNRPIARNWAYRKSPQIVGTVLAVLQAPGVQVLPAPAPEPLRDGVARISSA